MIRVRRSAAAMFAVALLILGLPLSPKGSTIEPGQVRVVEGTISAVDLAYRSVVVEVPRPTGALTVGVTLKPSVQPMANGEAVELADVRVGERAVLKYTREGGGLVGLGLTVHR